MSGFEVAGLALAILPLILSAAKRYNSVLRPFLRYRRYAKEVKTYSKELGIQRTIFRNECRNLLEEVTGHDSASRMLDLLAQETWSDRDLDARLVQHLGESLKACVMIIELVEGQLREVEVENQEFGTIVHQEQQATPKSMRPSEWRHNVGKKLCFSFSKSRLDRNIAALRSHNNDLRTLFAQTRQLAPMKSKTSNVSRYIRDDIRKYHAIGEASRQVYDALSKACNKHIEHLAHFRVEAEEVLLDEAATQQIKFHLAFTYVTLADPTGSGEPIWFVVDSTMIDQRAKPCGGEIVRLGELGKMLERQFEPTVPDQRNKIKKSLEFHTSVESPRPSASLTMASDAFSSENCMKRDLCDDLRRCFQRPRKSNVCVGILENTGKCKHHVYPSPFVSRILPKKAISLGQIIRSKAKPQYAGCIPVHERVGLAKILAIAVLQYHATPWLQLFWRSEDILFFDVKKKTEPRELPDLSTPHLNAKVKSCNGQLSNASTFSHIARNPILFRLGVILLEVAHAASLESLQQPGDLTNGKEDQHSEFFTARRLAKCKHSVMGIRYHNIVEQLVECVFPCGDDLKSDELQTAFYKDVICPLGELEEGLRRLHVSD